MMARYNSYGIIIDFLLIGNISYSILHTQYINYTNSNLTNILKHIMLLCNSCRKEVVLINDVCVTLLSKAET